jgi:hypothetical protein
MFGIYFAKPVHYRNFFKNSVIMFLFLGLEINSPVGLMILTCQFYSRTASVIILSISIAWSGVYGIGFEPKSGTVLSAVPDFMNYDPSLRAPASERDYDEELPAHAGVRVENSKREALLRSLKALKIRNFFRNGGMPRCKAHEEILRIESLPPIGPGFPTYTNDNLNITTTDERAPSSITELDTDR